MLKMKPSARLNRRYLLIEGNKKDIENAILDYVGVLGWAKASPFFLKGKKGKQILAINRGEINNIRGAFAMSADKIRVIRVSGTLKGLEK